MKLPNFFIVGAAKAGTTSLWRYLLQHPEIFMPSDIVYKEPAFFSDIKGGNNIDKYKSLFSGVRNESMIGEASTAYLTSPESPARIVTMIPNAKIIIMLRNPIDRAFSLYNWMAGNGYEPTESFEEALKIEESDRYGNVNFLKFNPEYYYNYLYFYSGLYSQQIKRYLDIFSKEQIHFIIFENFKSDIYHEIQLVYKFLGVNDTFRPEIKVHNKGSAPYSTRLQFFIRQELHKYLRPPHTHPHPLHNGIIAKLMNLNIRHENILQMKEETRQLLSQKYRRDVFFTAELIGIDLRQWWQDFQNNNKRNLLNQKVSKKDLMIDPDKYGDGILELTSNSSQKTINPLNRSEEELHLNDASGTHRIWMVADHQMTGGAAIACHRLFTGMRQNGRHLKFLTFNTPMSREPECYSWKSYLQKINGSDPTVGAGTDISAHQSWPNIISGVLSDNTPEIINIHNIHEAIHYHRVPFDVLDLMASKARLVFTLHDMWFLTGRCAYTGNCQRFIDHSCNETCPTPTIYPQARPNEISALLRAKIDFFQRNPEAVIVTPSQWLANQVKKSYLKDHRIEVIPYGIDTTVFRPDQDREGLRCSIGIPRNACVLLISAANLSDPRKGANLLLHALSKIKKDLIVLTVGKTSIKPKLPKNIKFYNYGFVNSPEEMACAYSVADLFVCPSLEDNLPCVLIEAISCGTPCIGYNVGGVPEVIRSGKTGWLAHEATSESLSKLISTLIENPKKIDDLRTSCREMAQKEYALNIQAKQYLKIYQQLIGQEAGMSHNTNNHQKNIENHLESEYEEIQKHIRNGENEEAKAKLERLIESHPGFAIGHNDLGVLSYQMGLKEEALKQYEVAAQLQPENIVFLKNLADCYYVELGQIEEAMKLYVKVLQLEPKDIETLQVVGHLCVALEKFSEAKNFYEKILEIDSENEEVRNLIEKLNVKCREIEKEQNDEKEPIVDNLVYLNDIGPNKYLVSAIVSTYNAEKFIRGCLENLENQTISNELEIIVVNSGSNENEEVIVRKFQMKYKNIKYIKTKDRENVYAAWNRGIKAASGKYITNANTDDRRFNDGIEILVKALEENPEAPLAYGNFYITDKPNNKSFDSHIVDRTNYPNYLRGSLLLSCYPGPMPVWRRSVHSEFGYFNESYFSAGDREFWCRISQKYELLRIKKHVGMYFLNPSGVENQNKKKGLVRQEAERILKRYKNSFKKEWYKYDQICLHVSGDFKQIKEEINRHETSGGGFRLQVDVSRCDLDEYLYLIKKKEEGLIYKLSLTEKGRERFPSVSLVMFTFDRLLYTKQTLHRLMQSTKYPFQLIIIDNKSSDGTREWLEKIRFLYAHRIVDIKYNNKNEGLPGPTNSFWQSINTDLVGKIDNDTLVPDGWLERLVEAHRKIPRLAIVGGYHFRPEDFDEKNAKSKIIEENGVKILTDRHIGGCCYLMKASVQKQFGLMEVHPTLKTHGWTQYQWMITNAGYIVGYLYPLVQLDYMDDPRSDKCLIENEYKDYSRNIWHERGIDYQSTDQLVNWIQNDAARITNQPVEMANVSTNHPVKTNYSHDKMPLVSIVILTYNQIEYTRLCLESIKSSTDLPIEIIVVDNCSTDGTVDYLEIESHDFCKLFPFRIIKNNKNLGFAGGNNVGVANARGEYVLLLNNDVVVTQGWIERMVACAQKHPMAGIIGPRSNYVSGPQLVDEVGYNTKTLEDLDTFSKQFAQKKSGKSSPLLRVVGFCMLIKKAVVDKIGGLDTHYGLGNFEDDDYSLRAALAGFESWVAEDCFVHHFGSRTFLGAKIDFKESLEKNWELFKKKWGLPIDMPYGSSYNISQMNVKSFDPRLHYIPLSVNGDESLQNQLENLSAAEQIEANTLLEKADRLFQKGQVDKGIETFLDGIRRIPKDYRIYVSLAEQLINCGRYQDALDVLNEIQTDANNLKITNEVKSIEIILLEGYCQEGLGNYDAAKKLAEHVLHIHPNNPDALNLSGILAYRKNEKNRVQEFFNRAIDADPDFGEPYTNLGSVLWETGDTNEALNHFERGFILSPTDIDIAVTYHEAVTALTEFKRAEPIVREALEQFTNNKKLHYILIDVLIKLGKFNRAMALIETIISAFGIQDGILSAALKLREQFGPIKIRKRTKRKASVSLCMIVKNEEEFLSKCLDRVKSIVDEIIIVDTGSKDRSRDIATVFGAQVFDFEWSDDFAEARNFSINKAKGDWIFIMDADELISPKDYKRFRKISAKKPSGITAVSFVTRNYCHRANTIGWNPNDGHYIQEEAGIGWLPSEKVRLFSNSKEIMFEGVVHEMVDPVLKRNGIKIKKSKIPIHHYGRLNTDRLDQKGQTYYEIGCKKLAEDGEDISAVRELAIQANILEKNTEAIALWEKFLSMHPNNDAISEAYVNMGTAYIRMKDYRKALTSAKKAVALYPEMKEAQYNLGMAELYNGNVDAAVTTLKRLLNSYPGFPPAQFMLAAAQYCRKDVTDKNGNMKKLKLSAFGPMLTYSIVELAEGLISANQYKLALSLIQNTIEDDIVSKDIMNLYAACLWDIKNSKDLSVNDPAETEGQALPIV